MNEEEASRLYHQIFSEDRRERWACWQRDGNTKGGVRPSGDHPLAEGSKTGRRWKGGVSYCNGYRLVRVGAHPRSTKKRPYVGEHILVAESALGAFLPLEAIVHHHNSVFDDNVPWNLVVCENQAYHLILHRRARALKACGNANWRSCVYCKRYDDPENLVFWRRYPEEDTTGHHPECKNNYQRRQWQEANPIEQRKRNKSYLAPAPA